MGHREAPRRLLVSVARSDKKDSALPFNDFRVAPVPAPWMNQIRNMLYFLANPSAHPLLNWGPVTMLTLTLDWMHCKYLGSDKLLYDGVFHVIIYKLLSGIAQQNMVPTWNLLKQIYGDLGTKNRFRRPPCSSGTLLGSLS